LPDDWQRTKPSEVVDEITRAAQRHEVPVQTLARVLYQEGKFGEPNHQILRSSPNPDRAVGLAQITQSKLNIMRRLAIDRGDVVRALELKHYSLADREQAFDVAAEILAYQRRLLGSWHASVAAYNVGENFVDDWLAGRDRSEPYEVYDPRQGKKKLETYGSRSDPVEDMGREDEAVRQSEVGRVAEICSYRFSRFPRRSTGLQDLRLSRS
jgi:soluble lytic murein transglycosylase-like protein